MYGISYKYKVALNNPSVTWIIRSIMRFVPIFLTILCYANAQVDVKIDILDQHSLRAFVYKKENATLVTFIASVNNDSVVFNSHDVKEVNKNTLLVLIRDKNLNIQKNDVLNYGLLFEDNGTYYEKTGTNVVKDVFLSKSRRHRRGINRFHEDNVRYSSFGNNHHHYHGNGGHYGHPPSHFGPPFPGHHVNSGHHVEFPDHHHGFDHHYPGGYHHCHHGSHGFEGSHNHHHSGEDFSHNSQSSEERHKSGTGDDGIKKKDDEPVTSTSTSTTQKIDIRFGKNVV